MLSHYSAETAIGKSNAPHKGDSNVWKNRPLSVASVNYAGNDVNVIKILNVRVPTRTWLMEKVILHSKRYKGMFWDKKERGRSSYQERLCDGRIWYLLRMSCLRANQEIRAIRARPPTIWKRGSKRHSWGIILSNRTYTTTSCSFSSTMIALFNLVPKKLIQNLNHKMTQLSSSF